MTESITNEQLYILYEGALKQLSGINENFENAMKLLLGIFVRGVRYEDEDGLMKLSFGINPSDPAFCDEEHALATIFKKGQHLIGDIATPVTAACLMLWYAKTRGITKEEIVELGKHSGSGTSSVTMQKLEDIKQDFADLINSENPDRIADFYFDAIKRYKKDSSIIMKCANVSSFVKGWPKLVQWVGVTGGLQHSLENADHYSTQDQQTLMLLLNVKLKKAYGDHIEIRDIIACMQPVENAYLSLYDIAGNAQLFEQFRRRPDDEQIAGCEKLAAAMRSFIYIQDLSLYSEVFGELLQYPSKEMGKASVVLSYAEAPASGSPMAVSEMKYLLGDYAYSPLFDLSVPLDFHYAEEETDPLSTVISEEDAKRIFNPRAFEEFIASGDSIFDIVSGKMKNNSPLTFCEITLFSSDANDRFTEDMRKELRNFFNLSESFRLNALVPEVKYYLEQYCETQAGVSAEEFICGARSVASLCKAAYRSHIKLIRTGKTVETVNVQLHQQFAKLFWQRFQALASGDAASPEFIAMAYAFKEIMSVDPTYPAGREEEYKQKLHVIVDKAEHYIIALKSDGKAERATSREQMKFILAKRLEAFASETLTQMRKAEDALRRVK